MPGLDGLPVSNPTGVFESALAGLPGEGEDATQPRAFLNYIVFDENMVGVAAHRVQVSDLAGFDAGEIATPAGLEELQDSVEITTNGYIYVWVSNGSEGTKVWFDDLTVVHTGGVVTQASDYDVWGSVLREERLDETKYRFGYQGQFAEKDEETGWSHFEAREYDPVIGRWMIRDPIGQHWSPYLAMGNNPLSRFDPDGRKDGPGGGLWSWFKGVVGIGPKYVPYDESTANYGDYDLEKTVFELDEFTVTEAKEEVLEPRNIVLDLILSKRSTQIDGSWVTVDHRGHAIGRYEIQAEVPDIGFGGVSTVKGAMTLYTVYRGIRSSKTVYWGITKNFARRQLEHAGRFDDIVPVFQNVTRKVARGIEQIKIEAHGLKNLENKINSISIRNKNLGEYYKSAVSYFKSLNP